MRKLLISCLMLPLITGCSLLNSSPGDGQKPDWNKLATTIQNRTRYVAAFAFTMTQVQPHKDKICETAAKISSMLESYDDRDASFEAVRSAVMNIVGQIADPNLRQVATIFVDMVLTEAFNYTWQYYEDMINRDEVRTSVLVAGAVGAGLREACEMVISMMSTEGRYASIFTVPGE